jgi:protein SCO1/2
MDCGASTFSQWLGCRSVCIYCPGPHENFGPVKPPLEVPNITGIDRRDTRFFRDLLRGRVTAIQLMFTGASPFAPTRQLPGARQKLWGQSRERHPALVLEHRPLTDTPDVRKAWLERSGRRGWTAVSPVEADLTSEPSSIVRQLVEDHSTVIHPVDRNGLPC